MDTGSGAEKVWEIEIQVKTNKYKDTKTLFDLPLCLCVSINYLCMKNDILFFERQKFRQWWFILLLVTINIIFIAGAIQQIIFGKSFGNNPTSDTGLIVANILFLLLTISFGVARLDTLITNEGIYIKFFPFHLKFKFYSKESISKIYIRSYSPIREYGGWGIRSRSGFGKGKAYNVSGSIGLQLEFVNGDKLLIGTNNADELEKAIQVFTSRN